MKALKLLLTLAAVTTIAVVVADVSLAGKEHEHDKQSKEAKHSEYSAEAMQAWQKSMTPGTHHEGLKNFVGEWKAQVKVWQEPGTEPQVSAGKCKYEMILGNRFLAQTMAGEAMGMPFEGMGLSGFDNMKNKHVTMWVDNMGTSILYSEGECSNHCSVETHRTTVKDPMTGTDKKVKMVSRVIDKDKHVFEWYMINDDGSEFKSMEITYTRI
jgi:hypothetical protein